MSLDKEYVRRGESGDEEAVRLKISYCNFRYVYYTHSGILIHLGLSQTAYWHISHAPHHAHTCMHEHAHSHFSFSFLSLFGSNVFLFYLSEEIRNGRKKSWALVALAGPGERAGLFYVAFSPSETPNWTWLLVWSTARPEWGTKDGNKRRKKEWKKKKSPRNLNQGIYDGWSCVWQLNISPVVGQGEFYCKYAGVGRQSVRFLFSHAWGETGQVTPACGRRSSPPLFAVAAVKMSLRLRCEVQQQEAKCSASGAHLLVGCV